MTTYKKTIGDEEINEMELFSFQGTIKVIDKIENITEKRLTTPCALRYNV